MAFIEMKRLCHVYHAGGENERTALSDIDLSIDEGEFVALLGANGSGKSTLARHINALLLPTSGKCIVDGMDTADTPRLWDIRSMVGMVFQNPDNQIVAAVVEDDVAFGPENLGVPPDEIRERVDEALRTVRMTEFKNFSPHLLSGGQKQRVAIAGALAMRTRCLVLDEPTAMLDPVGRREVIETVSRLNSERGITIVYVTHFMEEAARASRVILMEDGRIVGEGTPGQVLGDSAQMRRHRLDAPLAAKIAERLSAGGLRLPDGIVTNEELVAAICR